MQGTYCIIKEKNYMIIPIDAEKPPDQMPRAFMIKKKLSTNWIQKECSST